MLGYEKYEEKNNTKIVIFNLKKLIINFCFRFNFRDEKSNAIF